MRSLPHFPSQLLTALQLAAVVSSLRMSDFSVPEFANKGDRVVLRCGFEVDSVTEELYSVKWYKLDGRDVMTNFYTYKPTARGNHDQAKKYKADGVKVVLRESNQDHVTLNKLRIDSSGTYKCEVTTRNIIQSYYINGNRGNQPRFNAIEQEGRMQVVELPVDPPEIGGGERNYAYGDQLNLNCTSKPSYPPTRLTWYINNGKVTDNLVGDMVYRSEDDLYISTSFLSVQVQPRMFRNREIRIKCVADLSQEPIKASHLSGGEGFLLDVVKLPEALKLQTENTFDVSMVNSGIRLQMGLLSLFTLLHLI